MPDQQETFRCPNCGSVTCQRLSVPRPGKAPYLSSLYHCSVCTVVFTDPTAFTRGAESKPRRGPAPRSNVLMYDAWGRMNREKKDRE